MITVIATIEVDPAARPQLLEEFARIVPLVRAEPGCISYVPSIDVETEIPVQPPLRENVVVVVEQWESVAALKTHLETPHMREYRERVHEIVKSVVLHVVEPAVE